MLSQQAGPDADQEPCTLLRRKEGAVLAFDFGEKRIGVASGDLLMGIAHPLTTIATEANDQRFEQIAALIKEWRPVQLVVGLPLSMDGEEHAVTLLCKKFARRLHGRFSLPVTMVDERLSSVEASASLRAAGVAGRKQKVMLDQVAAQHILQSYFDGLSA
ncbi:Holliday junction resolvase RuvX [Pseudomethylobacillus aquaticus]|uniref:Putative pre-16S rRNA nuclease n=1 Tax=Pseudomethylobacillus aquaticus TaxID=2676064 RepID=A0A3N0V390_9PROT|nr:Holliday junction resolvase RuvX [Pseudomethylobacillus aquaticus]ROH87277.1 Holliday junction resolvase RuvX [Pseudomethylobacillus aquaticus]